MCVCKEAGEGRCSFLVLAVANFHSVTLCNICWSVHFPPMVLEMLMFYVLSVNK